MQTRKSLEKFHSSPNVRRITSDDDMRGLYSLSLSQLRNRSEFTDYNNYKPSPFNLRWIHGYNHKVGVINLNEAGSTTVFYAASNCAVLYNWTTNEMRILQGHRHTITCISSDAQGKWLVTADSGPENILIVWDSSDYFPQRTLFSPHGATKIAKVAISGDAKYLLSLGYGEKATLYWWIWSYGKDEPHATLETEISRDAVIDMGFNPYNSEQFLLMTKFDIWLGVSSKLFVIERGELKESDDYELKLRKPEKKISSNNGRLTCFVFVESTSQILVATSRGAVLIYGYTIDYRRGVNLSNYEHVKFVKIVKIEKHKINVIKNIDGVIVTGNNIGDIRFYDDQLKLLYWVHGFTVDSISGISFNISPRSYKIFDPKCNKPCQCWEKVITDVDVPVPGSVTQNLLKKKLPSDATTLGKPFLVRDFIVCTYNQGVGYVDFVNENFKVILDNKIASALTLSVHPEKPFVVIGYVDGKIEMYDFVQRHLFARLDLRDHYKVVVPPKCDSINGNCEIKFPSITVTCLRYSPSGLHLACGLDTGELIFLDPTTINVITGKPFKDTDNAIKQIVYSCDSLTLAFADAGRTVCVYKYDCKILNWTFIGKHRSHYKDITSLLFLPEKNTNGEYKLISVGSDRIMVEYDIGKSFGEHLEIYSLDRIDQTAIPLSTILWPTPKGVNVDDSRTDLPMVLLATDEHKYKIVNYYTTMTLSTVLGPRYEHPVRKMKLITKLDDDEEEHQYLLFATKNIIGLQKMPLDGNPWKHIGLLGHPKQIIDMCFREDSGTLFTIGAKDSCMCQWVANYRSVDTTTKQGGGDLDPYYCLIENGRPGWLFQEIRDLFYYIQILCQGTFSPAIRHVKDYIPIDSLPDLMRALGFFPSDYEVENLIIEAKYKVYLREPVTEIDFEEFVKLYLNHRPAFGYNYKKLKNAFSHFALTNNDDYFISRDEFIDILENYGEHFTRELSWYLLSILHGQSFEDRAAMVEGDFSFLSEDITYTDFLSYIIGVQEMDSISEQQSAQDSPTSQSQQTSSTVDSGEKK